MYNGTAKLIELFLNEDETISKRVIRQNRFHNSRGYKLVYAEYASLGINGYISITLDIQYGLTREYDRCEKEIDYLWSIMKNLGDAEEEY